MEPWLSFASTLIWQIIVLLVLFLFRNEVAALIRRMASLKIPGGGEATFHQPQASDAPAVAAEAREELALQGPDGFFTSEGVARLVQKSGLVGNKERVVQCYLLFQTEEQRTWLVSTPKHVFCVLDDENTRKSGRLIQWRLSTEDADPIVAHEYRAGAGLVDIGPRRNWLYSVYLHPSPRQLEQDIRMMVASAKRESV